MILAKTFKGKGIPFAEDHPTWHGKPLNPQQAEEVIALLNQSLSSPAPSLPIPQPPNGQRANGSAKPLPAPKYGPTDSVATRKPSEKP